MGGEEAPQDLNEVEKWEAFEGLHESLKRSEELFFGKGLLTAHTEGRPAWQYAAGGEARKWIEDQNKKRRGMQ